MPKKNHRTLDVKKDPLDLRDVLYEPTLGELPFRVDNRDAVPSILNQGQEGACTGFGLAAVANYLFHNRTDRHRRRSFVSPRMFYEMAKRYDEWEGEHYDGSSIRGAMKGWHKHGVCGEQDWPYRADEAGRLTLTRQKAALERRLGAYFRVRHLHLNHMHSALREVGILYASASVHTGWENVNKRTGRIPFENESIGGHAFAIVGYDDDGFWVQNSWGPSWGKQGFAHLSYADWLENGFDCWVAQLGVPTSNVTVDEVRAGGRVVNFDYIPHQAAVLNDIRLHYVNLGNDGQFSRSGLYSSSEETVEEIVEEGMLPAFKRWRGPRRVLLYAHGGLVSEQSGAIGVNRVRLQCLNNKIYPLHFVWETGLLETLGGIVGDAFRRDRLAGWPSVADRFRDLADEAIELGARPLGRPVWGQIKDNARRASRAAGPGSIEGGAAFVAKRLARLANEDGPLDIHLAGHSAGGVFQAYLLERLLALGLTVKTLTLFAPACTTDLFKSHVLGAGRAVERITVFNLTDEFERDDSVAAYGKSILYLVSESFEGQRQAPILGMDRFASADRTVRQALGPAAPVGESTVAYSRGGARVTLRSRSEKHGDFDNDAETLNSMLRIVLGSNQIAGGFQAAPAGSPAGRARAVVSRAG
jgi:hypothetical protein